LTNSGQRPDGLDEDRIGSQGSQWVVVPEEDEEEHCSYCW